jgi:hypothetical protein
MPHRPNCRSGTSVTAWGWIVLFGGIIDLLAGLYVMPGSDVGQDRGSHARVSVSRGKFSFIPFYPLWALTIITLGVFVIWALAPHGRALAEV